MLVPEIDASAMLVLQMQRYDNPSSRKYDGDHCDIFYGSCDHSFRFSLDRGNRWGFHNYFFWCSETHSLMSDLRSQIVWWKDLINVHRILASANRLFKTEIWCIYTGNRKNTPTCCLIYSLQDLTDCDKIWYMLSWINLWYINVNVFRLTWIVSLPYLVKLNIRVLQVNNS